MGKHILSPPSITPGTEFNQLISLSIYFTGVRQYQGHLSESNPGQKQEKQTLIRSVPKVSLTTRKQELTTIYTQQILVLNHETTIQQCINAMVVDQNVQWSAVWDSDKKDFSGIITIRDLLEMLVFFVDSLKEQIAREETASMPEQQFLGDFLERYLMIPQSSLATSGGDHSHTKSKSRVFRHLESGGAGIDEFKPDLSLLERIIDHVTLYEWFTVSKDIVKFYKSKLTQDITIDDTLHACLQYMNENGLSFLALLNQDKTMLQGCINYGYIMKFLVESYTGSDLSIFEEPLSSFDLTHHNLFPSYQKLVMVKDTDSLFTVLKKMRDCRVSCIPIERQLSQIEAHQTKTVGLSYLTDIMFLLRLPNFWTHLEEPVIKFVTDLNGLDEDFESTGANSNEGVQGVAAASKTRQRSSTLDDSETKKTGFGLLSGIVKDKLLKEVEESEEEGDKKELKDIQVQDEDQDEDGEGSDDDPNNQQTLYFVTPAPTDIIGSPFPPQLEHTPKREEEKAEPLLIAQCGIFMKSEAELQIEDLFGKIFGIERVLLMKKSDTLKEVIEKITLIPESKLLYVDIELGCPKVKNMLALSDLFAYIATNKQH